MSELYFGHNIAGKMLDKISCPYSNIQLYCNHFFSVVIGESGMEFEEILHEKIKVLALLVGFKDKLSLQEISI